MTARSMENSSLILSMKGISKEYGNVEALNNVDFAIQQGTIHGLVGENGAGKSTLIKILSGAVMASRGTIVFKGTPYRPQTPNHAHKAGIATVYQEFSLVPELSVAENVFLGKPHGNRVPGLVNLKQMHDLTREIFLQLGLELRSETKVKNLSIAQQQMVEIARAWSAEPNLVIFDEPTATLGPADVERLHGMIRGLKNIGVSVIYVSHRLEEVLSLCDYATVLRDGRLTGTVYIPDTSKDELIGLMIGRHLENRNIGGKVEASKVVLKIKDLSCEPKVKGVNLNLHRGEILGIGGLVGSGRTELLRAIFGADKIQRGDIFLDGAHTTIKDPKHAIDCGIGFLPEDRRGQALFFNFNIRENISIARLKKIANYGWLSASEKQMAHQHAQRLNIKSPSIDTEISYLSGGNQQKVVLARWLAAHCSILLFDEPTRGVDVGAKEEIYRLMHEFVTLGGAIIVVSSELPELISICDRILVMNDGFVVGEFSGSEATEEALLRKMVG